MTDISKKMARHPFFKGIAADLLKTFAAGALPIDYKAGQMVYREGDKADQFLLVLKGRVAVELHARGEQPIIIQTVGPDEVLGWSWLFPPYQRRFDARALDDVEAIAMDGRFLRKKAETDHRLGYELLKRFSQIVVERLQATRLQLLDIYGKPA